MVANENPRSVYFMGIAGTGMASVAGLAQAAGFKVSGSDNAIYPPMSDLIQRLGIPVFQPYSAENLLGAKPDLVVVANSLSRGNPEVEALLASGIAYTSFPAFLNTYFLKDRLPIVVAGTHGKTTTTSIIAHVLNSLGQNPSFMIGGIPINFAESFRLTSSKFFVIEGDEYDTCFFDKGPKFLHYAPRYLVLNNVEFDHVDIYPNINAIIEQFKKLIGLVNRPENITANLDDAVLASILSDLSLVSRVRQTFKDLGGARVADNGHHVKIKEVNLSSDRMLVRLDTASWGLLELSTELTGLYNAYNIAQAINCIEGIYSDGHLGVRVTAEMLVESIRSFRGVKRRLEHLGDVHGVSIYEDFAHHPTAVTHVIKTLKEREPNRRLLVAFEPKNATSRRNIFSDQYETAFRGADKVYLAPCPVDLRIPTKDRMDTNVLAQGIGSTATAFADTERLKSAITHDVSHGDIVLFMSCGSFSGIQSQIGSAISHKFDVGHEM